MARKTKTNLTFQVTVPQPDGYKIPDVRKILVDAIRANLPGEPEPEIKCHLTNKETSYA